MQFRTVLWNPTERRLRAVWRILLAMGVVFLFISLSSIGARLLLVAFFSVLAGVNADMTETGLQQLSQTAGAQITVVIVTFLGIGAATWLVTRFLDRRRFADLGFRLNRNWWLDLGFGLVLGALLMVGIFLVELAAGWIMVEAVMRDAIFRPFTLGLLLVPLVHYVSVGIYEETLTRGYLLHNLAEGSGFLGRRQGLLLAYGLSSSVFGLFHLMTPGATPFSTLSLILIGLFLGLAYVLTGELSIPIGLHISWNFFQGPVLGFPVSGTARPDSLVTIQQSGPSLWTGGAYGPEAGLISWLAIFAGSLLIVLWLRWRYGSVRLETALSAPPPASVGEAGAGDRPEPGQLPVILET